MEKCFHNLEAEIEVLQPSVIFLLGKQVSDFVISKFLGKTPELDGNFNYDSIQFQNIHLVPIHHPSYILVYKRKHLKNYMEGISRHILSFKKLASGEYN